MQLMEQPMVPGWYQSLTNTTVHKQTAGPASADVWKETHVGGGTNGEELGETEEECEGHFGKIYWKNNNKNLTAQSFYFQTETFHEICKSDRNWRQEVTLTQLTAK